MHLEATQPPLKLTARPDSPLQLSIKPWVPADILTLDCRPLTDIESAESELLSTYGKHFAFVGGLNFQQVSSAEYCLLLDERREDESSLAQKSRNEFKLENKLENVVIFGGDTSCRLTREISSRLHLPVSPAILGSFNNGETRVAILESVRGKDVFFVANTSGAVNETLMQTFLAAAAVKNSGRARSLCVLLPYYPYSRQDREAEARSPISSSVIANLLKTVGVNELLTLHIHNKAIAGAFGEVGFENIDSHGLFVPQLKPIIDGNKFVVVAPDFGAAKQATSFRSLLADNNMHGPMAQMDKVRDYSKPGIVANMTFVGNPEDVRDAIAIIPDDMIDTGGTMRTAARMLIEKMGAKKVVVCATHGIFTGDAIERFRNDKLPDGTRVVSHIFVTDSLSLRRARGDLVTVVPTAGLFAKAIAHMVSKGSIRGLNGWTGDDAHTANT